MQKIDPILADLKIMTGNFPQATGHYLKTFNELEGMYENEQEFKKMLPKWENQVVYEVWEHRASKNEGDLVFGTSVMKPGRVGDEFFFTRVASTSKGILCRNLFLS